MLRTLIAGLALTVTAVTAGPALAQQAAQKVEAEPTYVGSEVCRSCHLEHYDAWQQTIHSRMLQDARKNPDALVTEIDPAVIRADLEKIKDKLKVAPEDIYIPAVEDIDYTIGSQWKQRYLVKKDGRYYIAPVQFNIDTGTWVNYHEADWDQRPWMEKCGGCHATGVDLDKQDFVEPSVGCESCHGPGSRHAALPTSATFEKRATIVNPSKLTHGISVQICGSCHNRGTATQHESASWPVSYRPGKALETYFKSIDPSDKHMYPNRFSAGHHQQFIDWQKSKHADSGVDCISCHEVHDLAGDTTRGQTKAKGDQLCMDCHVQLNTEGAHSVHSFGNCANCHMPRIAKSAEGGDIRSHVFDVLLPEDTIKDKVPNSCQTCHYHKDADLAELQAEWDRLTERTAAPAPRSTQ